MDIFQIAKTHAQSVAHKKQEAEAKAHAKNIYEQVMYARANWPLFTTLEPRIIEVLKANASLTLAQCYKIAYHEFQMEYSISKVKSSSNPVPEGFAQTAFKGKQGEYYDGSPKTLVEPGTIGALEQTENSFWKTQVIPPSVKNFELKKILPSDLQVSGAAGEEPVSVTSLKPAMWTLNGARLVISGLQKPVRQFGYHVCLGGGVLNNAKSDKDLDLYFLPMGSDTAKPVELLQWLKKKWATTPQVIGSKEYPEEEPYIAKLKFQFDDGKKSRIDLFVLGSEKDKLSEADWTLVLSAYDPGIYKVELGEDRIVHREKKAVA